MNEENLGHYWLNLIFPLVSCLFFQNAFNSFIGDGADVSTVSIQYQSLLCGISTYYLYSKNFMFVLNETNVFRVCRTPVDMCLRTLHLSQLVRSNNFNPSDGVAYIIYNRSHSRIKLLLHWEWFGFVVYHKQMELAARFLKSYGRMPDFMNFAGTNWYSMLKELGSMLIFVLISYPIP